MKKILLLFFPILVCFSITTNAQRSIEIIPDQDTLFVCPDSTIQLSATEAFSYSWSPAAIFDDPTIQSPTLSLTVPTLVSLEANVNGIFRRDTILIIPTEPLLSLNSDNTEPICAGEVVTVSANNNVESQSLIWEFNEEIVVVDSIAGQLLVQPIESARFVATLNVSGCEVKDTIIVEVKEPQVVITNPDTVFLCKDDTVILSAQTRGSQANFLWMPAEGLQDSTAVNTNAFPKTNTKYYAQLTDQGCTVIDSVIVRIDSIPEDLSMTKDEDKEVYCQGDVVTLASPTYNPADYPIIMHEWSTILAHPMEGENPIGSVGFETPDSLFNLVFTAQDSATYKRITTSGGCVDSFEIDIPVIQPKDITITPDPAIICPGETITLTAEFDGEFDEIEWAEEMFIQGANDQKTVIVGPLSSTETFTITVTEKDCPSEQSHDVQALPALISLNSETVICEGDDIQLNFADFPGVTYMWSSNDDAGFDPSDPNITVSPSSTATYMLTAQFGECDPESGEITVNVINEADVNVSPTTLTICPGEDFQLNADGNAPSFAQEDFEWFFGGSTQTGSTLRITELFDDATFSVTYRVLRPDGVECFRDQGQAFVTVEPQPEILGFFLTPDNADMEGICLGESVDIVADIVGNTNGYNFQWMANSENIEGTGPNISDDPAENTSYKLTLTSPSDCITEATSPEIIVIAPQYAVPDIFTPNNDNVNDFFNIAFVGVKNLEDFIVEFKVFNRWGQIVYDNDTPETGWDGKVNGNPAPADVYVYKIVVRFPDGREEENTGEVTLVR